MRGFEVLAIGLVLFVVMIGLIWFDRVGWGGSGSYRVMR